MKCAKSVYTNKEVSEMLNISMTYLSRIAKKMNLDEDYLRLASGTWLWTDEAIDIVRNMRHRVKK